MPRHQVLLPTVGVLAVGVVIAVGASAATTSGPRSAPAPQAAPTRTSTPSPSSSSPAPTDSTPAVLPLAGRTVALNAGHNGGNAAAPRAIGRAVPAGGFAKPCDTTGTSTDAGYAEHAFTWDVVQRTAALLRARGATVVLVRQDDDGVGPCVDQRAAAANAVHADLAVSVHADGAAAGVRGFHVIEPALAPDGGNAAVLEPSARAAAALRLAFGDATGEPRATYPGALVEPGLTRRADLAGLNLSRVPAVFIECANMRNAADAALVTDPAWRQLAARGIADGVQAHLGAAG